MSASLDPFYLIIDGVQWLERLLPLGVKLVQLRVKDMDEPALRREISAAKTLCANHDCQLVINDHWRLAIEEGCDFVHLGQEDLEEADVAAIRAAGLKLGISTHDEAELAVALAHRPEYIALGPVYPTILKKMSWAPQGPERVAQWREKIGATPLVAIGGLTPERLSGVFDAGADAAAVVTDITRNANPEERTRQWLRETRQYLSK